MTESNKSRAAQSIRMWQSDSPDLSAELFSEDYLNHQEPSAGGSETAITLPEWRSVVAENHRAFRDLKVDILQQVAEGDQVATHWRFSGTHTGGAYMGLAASGKHISWTGVQIDRFAGGRIVESWVCWDKFTMFAALGLISDTPG